MTKIDPALRFIAKWSWAKKKEKSIKAQ